MQYYFVIDTDTYAGNFERPLCAYVTGCVGDCGVGQKEAEQARQELGDALDDLVGAEPDEHGCWRPVKIYPTPGIYNNGMGKVSKKKPSPWYPAYCSVAIVVHERPSDETFKLMVDRAQGYSEENGFKITGFRFVTERTVTEEEVIG